MSGNIDYIFTVDGGGSKTMGVLYSPQGREIATRKTGPTNLLRGAKAAGLTVNQLWQDVCKIANLSPQDIATNTHLVAGLAGAQLTNDRLRFESEIPSFGRQSLCSDGYLSLIGATNGKPGSLIVVGTGVVGHRLNPDGKSIELSGWGFPLGDVGGGAWLGWRSIASYVRFLDEGALNSSMWSEISKIIGTSRSEIIEWSQSATPSSFGALAPIVITAMTDGDSLANEIFLEGLKNIYSLSMALKSGNEQCYFAGGLSHIVTKSINSRYVKAQACLGNSTPNWGAYLIAKDKAPQEVVV